MTTAPSVRQTAAIPTRPVLSEGNLAHPQVSALLQLHLEAMHENSPPGSVHALIPVALEATDITFVTTWDGEALMGCGALKEVRQRGEVKSMRSTHPSHGTEESKSIPMVPSATMRSYSASVTPRSVL